MLRRRPIARTMARTAVIAGTATAVSGSVSRHQQAKAAQQQDAAAPEVQYVEAPAAAPASGLSPDAIEQLKQLANLKDQGILTEEEFTAQKAAILNG